MTVFAVGMPIANAWASRKALLRISASIELATDAWPYASAAGWVAEMQNPGARALLRRYESEERRNYDLGGGAGGGTASEE
jgi:hypothetical protein